MTNSPHLDAFLADVESYNQRFNLLRVRDDQISLVHPFWSRTEIENGLPLRLDWDILERIVPFYGDWHTVLCLDSEAASVVLLDDSRQVLHQWENIDAFVESLLFEPEEPIDPSGIIEDESWLDI